MPLAKLGLNRILPKTNVLSYLPRPISWFLGYRAKKPRAPPVWMRETSILLITMAAMLANFAVAMHAPLYTNYWHFTELIPSFAASCILIYSSIEAPFSQPRNLFGGHFLAALIGVCITKLFMTHHGNEKYLWLAGALSVACSSVIMDLTGTVHPPAGATALLPSVDVSVRKLGWNYLPLILIHSCLFFGIALLLNNICRRYPAVWISPKPAPAPAPQIVIDTASISVPSEFTLTGIERDQLEQIQRRFEASLEKRGA